MYSADEFYDTAEFEDEGNFEDFEEENMKICPCDELMRCPFGAKEQADCERFCFDQEALVNEEDYIVFDRTGTPHVVVAVKTEIGGG